MCVPLPSPYRPLKKCSNVVSRTCVCDWNRAADELQREAATHSDLRHQNVIPLIGVVFEPGHYGVILEYAMYGDLGHFIRRFNPVCHIY